MNAEEANRRMEMAAGLMRGMAASIEKFGGAVVSATCTVNQFNSNIIDTNISFKRPTPVRVIHLDGGFMFGNIRIKQTKFQKVINKYKLKKCEINSQRVRVKLYRVFEY